MIGFIILWVVSFIICYKTVTKCLLGVLKNYKEYGYTTKYADAFYEKAISFISSIIPFLNILILMLDLLNDYGFYKSLEEMDKKYGEIYLANGDFSNIDSKIRCLDGTNMRLKINKIIKFKDIKDKIKLGKIMNIFKFNKKDLEIEKLKDEIKNKDELIESLLQMRKELEEYKEEKMKTVPTIQVEQDEIKEEDPKLIPIMNFSSNDDDEIFETSRVNRL